MESLQENIEQGAERHNQLRAHLSKSKKKKSLLSNPQWNDKESKREMDKPMKPLTKERIKDSKPSSRGFKMIKKLTREEFMDQRSFLIILKPILGKIKDIKATC